jgi:hypothetical protein
MEYAVASAAARNTPHETPLRGHGGIERVNGHSAACASYRCVRRPLLNGHLSGSQALFRHGRQRVASLGLLRAPFSAEPESEIPKLCASSGVIANFTTVPKFEESAKKSINGLVKWLVLASSAQELGLTKGQ